MSGEPFDSEFIGLDFETSGLDPIFGLHVPLTLGLAWERGGAVESETFTFSIPGDFEPAAHRVNNLTYPRAYSDVKEIKLYADMGDRMLCDFLKHITKSAGFEGKFIPVGFNVGSFDMMFMKVFFPRATTYFSHRERELNSICSALDATGCYINAKNAALDYVQEVAETTKKQVKWHDAEFDAWAALMIKRWADDQLLKIADGEIIDYSD